MALIDDLKQQRAEYHERYNRSLSDEAYFLARLNDLDRAIAALEPPAEAAPEPDQQASAQPDPAEGTPVPGAGEESRDHSDDASEFAEEGYAPVVEAEPETIGFFISEGQSIELRSDGTTAPLTPIADPIWNEPEELVPLDAEAAKVLHDNMDQLLITTEPTKPEADSIAKAIDHYDPKAMAERDRFNPFNIFKREDA